MTLEECWVYQIVNSASNDLNKVSIDEVSRAVNSYRSFMPDDYIRTFNVGGRRWLDTEDREALADLIKDARK